MTEANFDVVVIGGGPGGYVAAIRAAQLGLKAACVEMRGKLGGTCLNVGCIPSKALLESSHLYEKARHDFAAHGIKASGLEADVQVMQARKAKVVEDLTKGIEGLFKKNKVTYIIGRAAFTSHKQISVKLKDGGEQVISARNFIIATGSDVATPPGITIDEKKIVSSTGALMFDRVPEHLVVIGGGVIGLELGSVWRRLGSRVTVVEYLDRIIPAEDGEVSKQFQRILEKQGFTFKLGQKAKTELKGEKVLVTMEPSNGGAQESIEADVVLVSTGRKPYTEGLDLNKAGVEINERGFIKTDKHLRTNVANIYAIGDVTLGAMLAHKAEEEGIMAAEIIAGQAGHVNYDAIPGVIYTDPEVASVGKTEEALKTAGVQYKVGKFPFMANSRGRATGRVDGFVKILSDSRSDKVLGVHIIGPDAGTMIQEAVMAIEFGASAEDIARTCHPHPTLQEAVKEAALAVDGRAVHI